MYYTLLKKIGEQSKKLRKISEKSADWHKMDNILVSISNTEKKYLKYCNIALILWKYGKYMKRWLRATIWLYVIGKIKSIV